MCQHQTIKSAVPQQAFPISVRWQVNFDGLAQDCHISSTLAMETLQIVPSH